MTGAIDVSVAHSAADFAEVERSFRGTSRCFVPITSWETKVRDAVGNRMPLTIENFAGIELGHLAYRHVDRIQHARP